MCDIILTWYLCFLQGLSTNKEQQVEQELYAQWKCLHQETEIRHCTQSIVYLCSYLMTLSAAVWGCKHTNPFHWKMRNSKYLWSLEQLQQQEEAEALCGFGNMH